MPNIITLSSNISWSAIGLNDRKSNVTRPIYDCIGYSSNDNETTTAHFNIWANGLSSVDGTLMPYRNYTSQNVPRLVVDCSGNYYSAGVATTIKPVIAVNNRHCVIGPPEPPPAPIVLPDYTFRFKFSDTSYDPTNVTGWKTGSTWTKVTTNDGTNQWDYTHATANWDDEFNGKFSAANNLVDVIAAGEFGGVTSMANKAFVNNKVAGGTFGSSNSQKTSYVRSICEFNTENVVNMNGMFFHSLISKVPKLNTSSCSAFWSMFDSCGSLKWADGFDFTNARILRSMFANCQLRIFPSLSSLGDTSKIISAHYMFQGNAMAGEYGSPGMSAAYSYLSSCVAGKYNNSTFVSAGTSSEAGRAERAVIPKSWGGDKA